MAIKTGLAFLQFSCSSVLIAVVFAVGKTLLSCIQSFRTFALAKMTELSSLPIEDFSESLFGLEMYKTVMKQMWLDIFKTVNMGSVLDGEEFLLHQVSQGDMMTEEIKSDENSNSLFLDDEVSGMESSGPETINIADLCQKDVPLVLNFGSCS